MAQYDVVVVGAGPAGAALAATATRAGMRVALLERARHPRAKACAEYASPRIVEELARIGLGDAWRPHAVPLDGMRLFVGHSSADITYADRSGRRTAWGLTRSSFDAALARHAAASGAELFEQTAFVGLVARDHDRVEGVEISRGGRERRRLTADWIIGADGARSAVARALGVERPVRMPRRLGFVAHHSGVPGLERHGEMHVGPGWYVGLAPTPGGEINVGMALPMEGNAAASARSRFDAALHGLPRVAHRLHGTRRLTPIRGAAPIGHRVSQVSGPGWMLIGDAAGFVDPFTGEGIYRALRSARLAAGALAAGVDAAAEYRGRRRAAFAAKDTLTWLVQGFLAWPPLLRHAVQRLDERPAAALRLGSALGDCRPATDALSPAALLSLFAP